MTLPFQKRRPRRMKGKRKRATAGAVSWRCFAHLFFSVSHTQLKSTLPVSYLNRHLNPLKPTYQPLSLRPKSSTATKPRRFFVPIFFLLRRNRHKTTTTIIIIRIVILITSGEEKTRPPSSRVKVARHRMTRITGNVSNWDGKTELARVDVTRKDQSRRLMVFSYHVNPTYHGKR